MSLYSRRLWRVFFLYLLSVLVLGFVRLESLIWNWPQFSHQTAGSLLEAFVVGARFDLAAGAWLILPNLLFALIPWPERFEKTWIRASFLLFVIVQTPFLIFNLVDVEFVNYVGRRMTADVLFLFQEAEGKTGGFLAAFTILIILAAVFVAGQALAAWKVLGLRPVRPAWAPSGRLARGVLGFLFFAGLVIASRGGLQNKPISFVNANVFPAPALNNLVLNTTFNILKNLDQQNLPRVKYFEDRAEMMRHLNGGVTAPSLLEGRRAPAPQNVVIMMLESFGLEYMGEPIGEKGWTPFLDSLARKGLFFRNGFANGRRSIEGVAAVMSGIPAMMNEPFITSPFTANRFVGLGTALTAKGYATSFFHGGNNGTMHFDSFMRSAGVDDYFGAREFPDPRWHDGVWGIYDGPFLDWMVTKIDAAKKPFMVSFFSISSHQPYLIPPEVRDRYPDGPIPILKTVAYTDDSLRRFFEQASTKPWFKDTLFVITADHTFKAYLPRFDNELGRYRVPILFYHPSFEWPAGIDRDQVVQQIDILPSVLDFLGVKQGEEIALGRSVFVPGPRTATLYLDGSYDIVDKDYFLHAPRGGRPAMYALDDAGKTKPLDEPAAKKAELETRLKASIQYFSEGMWDNRLYAPVGR